MDNTFLLLKRRHQESFYHMKAVLPVILCSLMSVVFVVSFKQIESVRYLLEK
jgi:hypothetical protein